MRESIQAMIEEWEYARMCTMEFIDNLGSEGLKKPLKRPELNTFTKHFEEMINVEEAYVNAIKTGKMVFDNMKSNDEFKGTTTKEELINKMNQLDQEMKLALEDIIDNYKIVWEEENKTIESHICALCTHELFHIGQLVAFCYMQNIPIPEAVINSWALSAQE